MRRSWPNWDWKRQPVCVSRRLARTCGFGLVLRTETLIWTVQLPEIKTLRRHERRADNPGATVMLEIADSCHQAECVPAALFYLGVGAAIQGLDELSHPPKVVYRASRRQAAVGTCFSQTTASARRDEFPGLR